MDFDVDYDQIEQDGAKALVVRWDLGPARSPGEVEYARHLVSAVVDAIALHTVVDRREPIGTGLLLRRGGRYYLRRTGAAWFESSRPRPVVAASGYANPAFEIFAAIGASSAATTAVLVLAKNALDVIVRALALNAEAEARREAFRAESARSRYMARVYDQASAVDVPPWLRPQFGGPATTGESVVELTTVPTDVLAGSRAPTRHRPSVSDDHTPEDALRALVADQVTRTLETLLAAGEGRARDLQADLLAEDEAKARISVARAASIAIGEIAVGDVNVDTEALSSRIVEILHREAEPVSNDIPGADDEGASDSGRPQLKIGRPRPGDGRPQLGGGSSVPWIAP